MNETFRAIGPTALFREFLRGFCSYMVVGGVSFYVDFCVLRCALDIGLPYLLATVLGFCAGLATNYLLCISWVWRGTQATTLRDFINFSLIGIGGLLLTLALMWLAVDIARLTPTLAKPFIAGIVLVWNFGLRRLFVFFR